MKFLKNLLFLVLGIIALGLIAALFISKDYVVEKEVSINKPQSLVFDYIKNLKNQDEYSVWMKLDPNVKNEFTGVDGSVGFKNAWEGNDAVGKGEQQITKVVDGSGIETSLHFIKPIDSFANATLLSTAVDSTSTVVKWKMSGSNPYPMNLMVPFMDAVIGGDLDKGLTNLKAVLEKK
jgi:hypothetical protein